ncbi:MAG: hypothetical protein PHR00_00090 [Patescibacteria group bacterium]|nr:hypothetical protein [Patescibacteria group bacterium]
MKKLFLFFALLIFLQARQSYAENGIKLELCTQPGSVHISSLGQWDDHNNSLFVKFIEETVASNLLMDVDSLLADVTIDISNTDGVLRAAFPRKTHASMHDTRTFFHQIKPYDSKKISFSAKYEKDSHYTYSFVFDGKEKRVFEDYLIAVVFKKIPTYGNIKIEATNIKLFVNTGQRHDLKIIEKIEKNILVGLNWQMIDQKVEDEKKIDYPIMKNVLLPEIFIKTQSSCDGKIIASGSIIIHNAGEIKSFSAKLNIAKTTWEHCTGQQKVNIESFKISSSNFTIKTNQTNDFENINIVGTKSNDYADEPGAIFKFEIIANALTGCYLQFIKIELNEQNQEIIESTRFMLTAGSYCNFSEYLAKLWP